jgi:CheY-like chemotaxis protein
MPELTGDRLAEEIMKIRPDIPVILCTGYSERIDHDRARALGISTLVEKPIEKRELARVLRKVLDEGD